jgi:hypothetical protein
MHEIIVGFMTVYPLTFCATPSISSKLVTPRYYCAPTVLKMCHSHIIMGFEVLLNSLMTENPLLVPGCLRAIVICRLSCDPLRIGYAAMQVPGAIHSRHWDMPMNCSRSLLCTCDRSIQMRYDVSLLCWGWTIIPNTFDLSGDHLPSATTKRSP